MIFSQKLQLIRKNKGLTQEDVQETETNELINKIYDGSVDKLFAALLGRKKLSTEQIEKLKQIVDSLE